MRPGKIYLIGLMGAGKSTVGRILGKTLDWQFQDLDEEIQKLTGRKISNIFKELGEAKFREYESQALLATARLNTTIISCGGGIVTSPENREYLANQMTVWLDVTPGEAASRLKGSDDRPLLECCDDTIEKLGSILASRQAAYAHAASIQIHTGQKAPQVIVEEILDKLERENA